MGIYPLTLAEPEPEPDQENDFPPLGIYPPTLVEPEPEPEQENTRIFDFSWMLAEPEPEPEIEINIYNSEPFTISSSQLASNRQAGGIRMGNGPENTMPYYGFIFTGQNLEPPFPTQPPFTPAATQPYQDLVGWTVTINETVPITSPLNNRTATIVAHGNHYNGFQWIGIGPPLWLEPNIFSDVITTQFTQTVTITIDEEGEVQVSGIVVNKITFTPPEPEPEP